MGYEWDQGKSDSIADVIWWIKGAMASDVHGCDFDYRHIDALRTARQVLDEATSDKKASA